ncbi:hypothetical protein L226DRAFT_570021 [Lentinus tigrinus ALCF2SS1-7]|uniref:Uncharacterized protein n=1 Tax=Lentinus tigrinus ALCF2SS1-6 TaxID=1328759 RepID=A0A5C2S9X9_9APHY|nr:hypothetical protein L227DRAFT_653226 [Lentinus tigrinus ALCF2SS1-6]RPD75771.1 hypothetical protein L226DRAFT_570021 [Lentinus tigrinus ALCF2SS1-7]
MPPPPHASGPASATHNISTVSISHSIPTAVLLSHTSIPTTSLLSHTPSLTDTLTEPSKGSVRQSAATHIVKHTTTTFHLTRFTTITIHSRTSDSSSSQDSSSATTNVWSSPPATPVPEATAGATITAVTFVNPPPTSSSSSGSTSSSPTSDIWVLPSSSFPYTAYMAVQTYSSTGSGSAAPASSNSTLSAEVLAGMIMGVIAVFIALCSLLVVLCQRRPNLFKGTRGAMSRVFSRRRSVDSDVQPLRRSSPSPFTLQLSGAAPVSDKLGTTTYQEEAEADMRDPGRSLRASAATGTSETIYIIAQPTGSTAAEPPTPPPPLPDQPGGTAGRARRTSRPPRKRGKIVEEPVQPYPGG